MRFLLLFLSILLSCSLEAAEWYVKPTGSGTQSGADIDNAIGAASVDSSSAAGDTWRLLGGYGNFPSLYISKNNRKIYSCDDLGYTNKWSAIIVGSAGTHGITTADGVTGTYIWGVHIASSYIDGIKYNGNQGTNIDCWIQNAGRGNPLWDTSGTYRGQGIAFHTKKDMHFERNLVENCGAMPTQDHGFYGSGTNILIRGNIVRSNMAWGLQIYEASPSDNDNVVMEDNLIHDNGYTGTSNSGLTFWTYGANKRSRFVNNTLIARTGKYGAIITQENSSSKLGVTNNIIVGDDGYGVFLANGTAGTNAVWSDYNLKSTIVSTEPQGSHDVQGTATFDSIANGRYWLATGSTGIGIALASAYPATDFFGRTQATVADVGFTQYEIQLAEDDSRNLGDGARDPWVREPKPFSVTQGVTAMQITWTEINQQHALQYIQRKDSVGNTYGILTSIVKGTTSYDDPLSGLTNGLTYTYTATPETSLGNSGGIHAIAVAKTYAAPVISSISVTLITTTTARLTWTTDTAATARVTYNGGTLSTNDANLATSHLINLTGLTAGTLYTYSCYSSNSGGATLSTPATFTTQSGTIPAPVISLLSSSAITTTSATISWTTDSNATAYVTYNGLTSTNDPNLGTSHSIFLTSLTPSTLYTYSGTSTNAGGSTTSSNLTFTTLTPTVTPPPVGDLTVAAAAYYPRFVPNAGNRPASSGKSPLKFAEDPAFIYYSFQAN